MQERFYKVVGKGFRIVGKVIPQRKSGKGFKIPGKVIQ